MEENKNSFDKIDELLESTSSDKRIKFDLNDVETVEGPKIDDPVEEYAPNTVEVAPVEEKEPAVEDKPQGIQVIDETSTTITFEEGPDISIDELMPADTKKKKVKGPKEKLKFKPVQIIIIAVVSLITLWTIFFTVDHTLAAQGISPVFCKQSAVYEDGSQSYKGLGYKVQFKFDANGKLTQKCVPAWKDGPNDIVHQ